ncbi:hypothetical protein CIL05_03585 [Virgibacillus profundi]|uniref:Uncharacterized protein n=1 Tax=Virgibacillus profundi TaxID=2024555 RepID=A0A2A2IHT9_9BACI|nr:tetratricopeptide repeat protein [Virgibacillus profundi]PAV30814.1 hypothetical protein CIL05_03585 [Virgibacillus profundi]PXY54997.1 tetratricopeptide repeat protein [Virgibacillus profundi]
MPNNRKVSPDKLLSLREEIKNHSNAQDEKAKNAVQELEAHMDIVEEMDTNEKFSLYATLAKYFRNINHYDKCASYSRRAINLAKRLDKAHTGILIDTYLDYAGLEREYGQSADARILLAKLLQLLETKEWGDPLSFGLTFSNLGKVYLDEENSQLGIFQLENALKYFRKVCGHTHPIIAETIQAISEASIEMEDYSRAMSLNQELLEAFQKENNNVQAAKTLLRTGEIYYYIDLKKARDSIVESLSLLKDLYKTSHLDIAKAYLMLAELEENVGELPRAIAYYKQSLSQLEDICKADHYLIVYTYSKLGSLTLQINDLDSAKGYLEKGLSLSTKFPEIRLRFLMQSGKVYSNLNMHEQAATKYLEFLKDLKGERRTNSRGYAGILQDTAFSLLKLNNLEEAADYYAKALSVYEGLKGNYQKEMDQIHNRLAYCFENIQDGDMQKAALHMEEGIELLGDERTEETLKNKERIEMSYTGG